DPALLGATIAEAQRQSRERIGQLEAEQVGLNRDLGKWGADIRKLVAQGATGDDTPPAAARADLNERISNGESRAPEAHEEISGLQRHLVDDREIEDALGSFDTLWTSLTPREQVRIVQLLVERVDYDGSKGKVLVTFRPTGIKTLAGEFAAERTEKIA